MAIGVRLRFSILKRDHFRCVYCGAEAKDARLEIDHVVPRCEGGTDDPQNLVTACWLCNAGKGGIPIYEDVPPRSEGWDRERLPIPPLPNEEEWN